MKKAAISFITIIVTAAAIIGILYGVYKLVMVKPASTLPSNQVVSEFVREEVTALESEEAGMMVYSGHGFTFSYPDQFELIDGHLFHQDRVEAYQNDTTPVNDIPDIAINVVDDYNGSVDDYLGDKVNMTAAEIDELVEDGEAELVMSKLGENMFTTLALKEKLAVTYYVTEHEGMIVAFSRWTDNLDDDELEEIIMTLIFE